MKLKKFVAAAAAAVMSLAMLTACSGGGGSAVVPAGFSYTWKSVTLEENGKKYTEENGPTNYDTSDGKSHYEKNTYYNYDGTKRSVEYLYILNTSDNTSDAYLVNTDTTPWKAYKMQDSGESSTELKLVSSNKENGEEEYNGETYKTVRNTYKYNDGSESIVTNYYNKNNELVYEKTEFKSNYGAHTRFQKVLIDNNKVDPENTDKLDFNNYTLVNSPEELGR